MVDEGRYNTDDVQSVAKMIGADPEDIAGRKEGVDVQLLLLLLGQTDSGSFLVFGQSDINFPDQIFVSFRISQSGIPLCKNSQCGRQHPLWGSHRSKAIQGRSKRHHRYRRVKG